MNAKKCDRCGAFYTVVEPDAITAAVQALGECLRSEAFGDRFSLFEVLKGHADLCGDCEKSLKVWAGEAKR